MNPVIKASQLSKRYGATFAIDGIDLSIDAGRIVGLIGPNGSGKTTTLKALLGLIPFEGQLSVAGLNPRTQRDALMREVCFIADIATLPRWLTVAGAIDLLDAVHPNFNRAAAERHTEKTRLTPHMKVGAMSKGMVVQLHLALVMAIDAKILVLDEPTLGLDLLYSKRFYQTLLDDYFDQGKTVIISSHQLEEIEHILTDVLFIRDGKIVLSGTTDEIGTRFTEVSVKGDKLNEAAALQPISSNIVFGKSVMLFDGVPKARLDLIGAVSKPSLANLFVSTMEGSAP
jgi:ABC-2 type transport system ATP-binding protein